MSLNPPPRTTDWVAVWQDFRCYTTLGMRFKLTLFCLVLVTAAACSDVVGPNTDVGLSVWTEVKPSLVSIGDTAAVLRIRVYVNNPSFVEIRVISGGPPYGGGWDPATSRGLWGSVRIASDSSEFNGGPNVSWWGQPVYVFRPRSTQYSEMLVSLRDWKAGGWPLVPGRYLARGWMNTREGRSAEFVLTP